MGGSLNARLNSESNAVSLTIFRPSIVSAVCFGTRISLVFFSFLLNENVAFHVPIRNLRNLHEKLDHKKTDRHYSSGPMNKNMQ